MLASEDILWAVVMEKTTELPWAWPRMGKRATGILVFKKERPRARMRGSRGTTPSIAGPLRGGAEPSRYPGLTQAPSEAQQ